MSYEIRSCDVHGDKYFDLYKDDVFIDTYIHHYNAVKAVDVYVMEDAFKAFQEVHAGSRYLAEPFTCASSGMGLRKG